jgi:hypothetical protein
VDPRSPTARPIAAAVGALEQLPGASERFRALLDARALTRTRLADALLYETDLGPIAQRFVTI